MEQILGEWEEKAGKESGVQREVDTAVELARFCAGFSRPLIEVCCFLLACTFPPPLLPYSVLEPG